MKSYFLYLNSKINSKKIILFFLGLFLLTLPLNTKKFILTFDYPLSEFNSLFLYLNDLTLILFLIIFIFLFRKDFSNFEREFLKFKFLKVFFILFLFSLLFSLFLANNKILALDQFIRLILLFIFILSLVFLFNQGILNLNNLKYLILILVLVGIFQSFLGIFQFLKGRSLNFYFLGEPIMNQFLKGVARYQILDLSFLRSVGTLPHANIYAAFLILILGCFYYLWFLDFKKFNNLKRVFLGVGIFLTFLALIYSFSRSGWLSFIFLSILILIYGFFNKNLRKKAFFLFLILLFFYFLIEVRLNWLIKPRLNLPLNSPSVNYRLIYNQISFELFKERPFGVGLKNQVLYLKENFFYQKKGLLDNIEFQPVHNLFLIILNEIGILGFLTFFGFLFFTLIYLIFKNINIFKNFEFVWVLILFFTFLFFGLFDHFFWTLQSGRLMFFFVIALIFSFGFNFRKSL